MSVEKGNRFAQEYVGESASFRLNGDTKFVGGRLTAGERVVVVSERVDGSQALLARVIAARDGGE